MVNIALPRRPAVYLAASPPCIVDENPESFVVREHYGQALACIYFEERTSGLPSRPICVP